MNKNIFLGLIFSLTLTLMHAQTKFLQKTERGMSPEDITIPFTKYQLANGLIVIIHEDHSDPIVHVDVTYHVGSAREEIGKSGFAHFFEHMMFQGSKNVGDEEHFKIVTQAGGSMNGTTNRDRTNYFETVPKNYLETALWLEADRMGFLLEAVTQKKFEIQRATVKNEKGQRYENRPYGMIGEIASKNFYPYGHPYAWPTIGYVEDLDRVTVDDLKKFFLRWYGPNNAVLTIGGDINPEETLKLVEKYFGSIERGPEVKKPTAPSFKLEKDRYISYEDNVRFPMLKIMYPTVPAYHADEPALDILSEILGGGKSSILYKNFIKTKKAVQAYTAHPCSELSGDFSFNVLAYPGTKLDETEKMIRDAMEEFIKRGINDEDIKKAVSMHQANFVYALESVSGKVSQLAAYQTFTGDADFISKDYNRYNKITKNDIIRVFDQYIKGQKALILSVYPKGKKEIIAAADNHKAGGDTVVVKNPEMDKLAMRTPKDNFDRSKKPAPGPSPVVVPPYYTTQKLGNGINMIVSRNPEVPDLYLQLNVKCGQWRQPKGKEGVAYLLARMLQESTKNMSAEAINDALDKLGSHLNVYADEENITINVMSLTRNAEQTLGLLNEIITMPKFDAEEFDRVKKQQLELIANQKIRPEALASETFNRLIYGADHAMGTPLYGTTQSVQTISLDDVKNYYDQYFSPTIATLMISGDVTEGQVMGLVGPFMGWQPKEVPEVKLGQTPEIKETKIYLVNKENAPQSEIRIGYLAMPYDATGEYYKAQIMNYILGGAFNSRINLNLREDKGYTYGARSSFAGTHIPGPYLAAAGVRGDATDSAVYEFMKEIKLYAEKGIKKDELEFTKKSILEREALKYETNSQKAGFLERIIEYNLPADYTKQQAEILKKMKVKEVNNLAKKYLPLNKLVIVVVGDKKAHKEALGKLGYGEVIELKDDFVNKNFKPDGSAE